MERRFEPARALAGQSGVCGLSKGVSWRSRERRCWYAETRRVLRTHEFQQEDGGGLPSVCQRNGTQKKVKNTEPHLRCCNTMCVWWAISSISSGGNPNLQHRQTPYTDDEWRLLVGGVLLLCPNSSLRRWCRDLSPIAQVNGVHLHDAALLVADGLCEGRETATQNEGGRPLESRRRRPPLPWLCHSLNTPTFSGLVDLLNQARKASEFAHPRVGRDVEWSHSGLKLQTQIASRIRRANFSFSR